MSTAQHSKVPSPIQPYTPPISDGEEHQTTPYNQGKLMEKREADSKNRKETLEPDPGSPIQKLQKTESWLIRDKLSGEFKNTDDKDGLGNLVNAEGEKLLALVDDIRKIESLRSVELEIPQLVVVGDTSAGKSSVLQALTRLPFPVAGHFCTRFVTETTIRRCGPSERPGYKIEVRMNTDTNSGVLPFPPKTFDSFEWVEVYEDLKAAIVDAFDAMSLENMPPAKGPRRTGFPQNRLLKHTLLISVRKPDQAHFSVVDIPGLVSGEQPVLSFCYLVPGPVHLFDMGIADFTIPNTGTSDAEVELSNELARSYIKNKEAIILAITPADNVLDNQGVFRLIKEKEGAIDRTIGVITKCDRIEKGDMRKIFDRLRNPVGSFYHLKLGWFAVKNRNSEEVDSKESFETRDRKELEMFAEGEWKEAVSSPHSGKSIDPDVLGINFLRIALRKNIHKRVKESFPSLKTKMKDMRNKYEAQIENMGDARDSPALQRSYLSDTQSDYEKEVRRALEGDYDSRQKADHPSHLQHHIKKLSEEFGDEMRWKAIKYYWQENSDDDENLNRRFHDASGDVHLGEIFGWIIQRWNDNRGSETRDDAPKNLKKNLFKEQTESWERRARAYVKKVEDAIRDCNDNLFEAVCGDKVLLARIRDKLEPLEIEGFKFAATELQNILGDRDYIDSMNPMLETYSKELRDARAKRILEKSLLNQDNGANASTMTSAEHIATQTRYWENFRAQTERVYGIHDWLNAYCKVESPRFVDNIIIQVVERHLLGPKGPLRRFSRAWIDRLNDEELEKLAGEDEVTVNERKALKEKVKGLEDALKKADIALR